MPLELKVETLMQPGIRFPLAKNVAFPVTGSETDIVALFLNLGDETLANSTVFIATRTKRVKLAEDVPATFDAETV